MFVYTLPSRPFYLPFFHKPLLTRIEVTGPYVTLYGRKTMVGELDNTLQELGGKFINAYDLEHGSVHSPETLLETESHVHYKLATKSIQEGIAGLITAIFNRQISHKLRCQDYQSMVEDYEAQRKSLGDNELPSYIRKQIRQFDTSSPFFRSSDCNKLVQNVLSKYANYCEKLSKERCQELLFIHIFGALQPVRHCFGSFFQPAEIRLDDQEKKEAILKVLDPLLEINSRFKRMQDKPLNLALLAEIQYLISEIDVEALKALEHPEDNFLTSETSLVKSLDYISRYVEKRVGDVRQFQRITRCIPYSTLRAIADYISSLLWFKVYS